MRTECKACRHHMDENDRLRDELQTVIMMANQRIGIADDRCKAIEERFLQAMAELNHIRRLSGINLEAITSGASEAWKN